LTGENFIWAFTTPYVGNWVPLTWVSKMIEFQCFGARSGLQHLLNVALHAVSTLLLFFLLAKLTGALWRSFFVAFVFGLHPIHVESVAWVTERKDVLSGVFFMLTLWAYVAYARRPDVRRYLLMLLLFCCSLLSKPMMVTFPVVALLMDYWPLGRLRPRHNWSLVIEKLPLLLISAAVSLVTYLAQANGGAVSSLTQTPISARAANIATSYITYLIQTLWPVGLSVFYPYRYHVPLWESGSAAAIVIAISTLAWARRTSCPYLFFGWFWFLITLLPVIGIIQQGAQAHADHFMYIPLIGIAVVIAWGVDDVATHSHISWGGGPWNRLLRMDCDDVDSNRLLARQHPAFSACR
jgi:hypothetical protein